MDNDMDNEAPGTVVWIRPSGAKIETNDLPGTVEFCESQGWQLADPPKRRGRPPKDRSAEEPGPADGGEGEAL